MQSQLYAKAIQRILVQELVDYQVIISEAPDKTVQRCNMFEPYALLMEVTGYTPWMLEERLAIRQEVKQKLPNCKIVILVDDNADKALADKVKDAKKDGLIDAFLFGSATDSYLAAMMDSL
jgi:DNA-binding NarL/FixJ family response regulator